MWRTRYAVLMKISLQWLGDWIDWIEKDPMAIANRLTLSSAEVEEVEMQGKLLNHCCVGKVKKIERHPDADRLTVCEVETDRGTKTVVCGGTNLREGMLVAFAHIGATVKWHGAELATLEPVKIRGVQSEGMICAAEELELAGLLPATKEEGERAIMDLDRLTGIKLKAGQSLREVLNRNDAILHINNTAITMRPDLFSHLGFARECVAIGLAKWKKKPAYTMPKFPSSSIPFAMKVDCPELVSRYCSCLLTVDGIGETPDWMRKRLEATGWRCVNLPVDITNYVTMELGMPLHSFDADDLEGDVTLRLSKKGETVTTLDDVKRPLPDGALVLSDDKGIFDLLGIMGGLRSSTKTSTKKIYLHAAALDQNTIHKAIRTMGHRTDASTVYEKGVAPITAEQGFIRALQLFMELVPGCAIASKLDSWGKNGTAKSIALPVDDVTGVLGMDISEKNMKSMLESLECDVKKGKKGELAVTPPLHRLRDLKGPHDLIEEIGRLHGYEHLPETMPHAELRLPQKPQQLHQLRDALRSHGGIEIVPLSFVSAALLRRSTFDPSIAVEIMNPLGEETAYLQTHVLPHLLDHATREWKDGRSELRTFHIANVFAKHASERLQAGVLVALRNDVPLAADPLFDLKGRMTSVLSGLGYAATFSQTNAAPTFAHPGRTAEILVGKEAVGLLCEVHPLLIDAFKLPGRAVFCTLDLSTLFALPSRPHTLKEIPNFPAVRYDVTIRRAQNDAMTKLLTKLRTASTLLEDVAVTDLYQGKNTPAAHFDATLRFTYRSGERTLTEEEVKKEHEKVLAILGKE